MQNRIQISQVTYISPVAAPFFRLFGMFLLLIAALSLGSGVYHSLDKQSWVQLYAKLPGASVVGALGFGCWFLANKIRQTRLAQVERFKKFPNKPWLWREDWAAKRIFLNDRLPKVLLGLFALGLIAALYGAFRYDQSKPDGGMMSWWSVAIAIVAWMGFSIYRLNRRWRRSELEIETLPGRIGGEFRGTVWLSDRIAPSTPFCAYLSCEELTWFRKSSASRDSNGITTRILWNTEIEAEALNDVSVEGKTPIPLAFRIPEKLEPTTMDEHPTSEDFDLPKGPARRIEWWLTIKPHERQDFRSIRFCIPVFSMVSDSKKIKRKRSS